MTTSDDAASSDRVRRAKALNWMRHQTGDLSFSAADVVRFLKRFDASDAPQSPPATRKSLALVVLDALQQDRRREKEWASRQPAPFAERVGGLRLRTTAPTRSSDRFDPGPEDYPFDDEEIGGLSFPNAILDVGGYVTTYCENCGEVIPEDEGCVFPSDTDYVASANEDESATLCEKCAAGLNSDGSVRRTYL